MKKRILALVLCCALAIGMVPTMLSAAFTDGTAPEICVYGAPATSVSFAKDEKRELTVSGAEATDAVQWQIRAGDELWVDIAGEQSAAISLSYAMVASLLQNGAVDIRCKLTNAAGNVYYTNAITASVYEPMHETGAVALPGTVLREAEAIGEPLVTAPMAAPAFVPTFDGLSDVLSDEGSLVDANGEETPDTTTYSIVINYVFQDGTQAANPWTATVAKGSSHVQVVTSPVVVGYVPDQETVNVNVTDAKADTPYTVTYSPAEVSFTVNHYQQNVSNDNYTLVNTETKTGFTESAVGEGLPATYDGFYALLYDTTTKIAADGSTVVEIYYDRYYYLMTFDLDGGYGVEPIYARYGTPISVGTPTKPGYKFKGWTPEVPATMPNQATTIQAQWEVTEKAKVTVVVWGENANDEAYTYYKNAEIEATPGETLTLEKLQGKLVCGKEEHTHSGACGLNCNHVHTLECYGLSANASSTNPNSHTAGWCHSKPEDYFAQLGLDDGYLYYDDENAMLDSKDNYYLRLNGKYYKLNQTQFNKLKGTQVGDTSDGTRRYPDYYYKYEVKTSGMTCTHTHTDVCYACGKVEHTHTSACHYNTSFMDNPELWRMVKSDEVTVAADGSTILNVYYDRVEFTLHFRKKNSNKDDYGTIKAKWGASILKEFAAKSKLAGSTNWSRNSDGSSPWTTILDAMPTENRIYYVNKQGSGTSTATYYGEMLDGGYEVIYENITTGTGYTVSEEEFIEFEGFTFEPEKSSKVDDDFNGAEFYYKRNRYTLRFYNYTSELTGNEKKVLFGDKLTKHTFTPPYPQGLEPGAYEFEGWYTEAQFRNRVNETTTMPAAADETGGLMLYAKWTPKTHTVNFYLTKGLMEAAGTAWESQNVLHGEMLSALHGTPEHPASKEYIFVGWFYKDGSVEKAFDPTNMPVTRDLNLYAKWSSNTMVPYTIYFKDKSGNEIAAPITGSGLAGQTKTFNAKTGTALNEGYQTGYYPETGSHSLTLEIEGTNEYTFVYQQAAQVTYTVRYLEKETENELYASKTLTTSAAVVTETFVPVSGYRPDMYQKRLVLGAGAATNVITFWYEKDEQHAPVQIIHWIQNIVGDGYTEYQSSTDLNAVIGNEYTADVLPIPGFRYNSSSSTSSGVLTADGLVLNLYYDRIEYPYAFRFLEQGTDKELMTPETGSARYQAQVTQGAKTIPGYTLVSAENQAINIAIEDPANVASKNVKTFYYTEQTVDIKYQVVGPDGCGTLDSYQDAQLEVTTGVVNGSKPSAAASFKFVGWYTDAECTTPVNSDWVATDNRLTPRKTLNLGDNVMGYEAATYYAKFEYDLTELTIAKSGCEAIDENQSFIFTVSDASGVVATVTVTGNNSVTVTGLKVGTEYTVTEQTAWSWRYQPDKNPLKQSLVVAKDANVVTFSNTRTNEKWLNGCAIEVNNWAVGVSSVMRNLWNAVTRVFD